MSTTYVIPDLHGRADLLELGLDRIYAHNGPSPRTIVVLGDYVDKGPESRQVIERLMRGVRHGWSLVCLRGNHDALMVAALDNSSAVSNWLQKGGNAALRSYGISSPADMHQIPKSHRDWLEKLALMHVDKNRIFVHAGLNAEVSLEKQDVQTLLWKRYDKKEASNGYRGRHIVHGHDSSASNPLILPGRTNLDALAWRTGRLVIGVYDDDKPGPAISYIEVRTASPSREAASISTVGGPRSAEPSPPAGLWQRLRSWWF